MQKKFSKKIIIAAIGLAILSGCSSVKKENSLTGEKDFTDSAKWATLGVTGGAAIGGIGGAGGALVGAAIGGAVGGYYGYTLDRAAEELSEEIETMGVEVVDKDGVIFITIRDHILFDAGRESLNDESISLLQQIVSTISQVDEDFFIKVSGHTDNTGDFKFNISLSEQRAKNVAHYLYENKIGAKAIDYRGFADLMPLKDNKTEDGKAENRRVEIQIIPNTVAY